MESDLHRPRGAPVEPAVEAWRRDLLTQAGFEAQLARQLAADPAVDMHELLELVERGCPPAIAARILAPL
jgi:hypothetical protein